MKKQWNNLHWNCHLLQEKEEEIRQLEVKWKEEKKGRIEAQKRSLFLPKIPHLELLLVWTIYSNKSRIWIRVRKRKTSNMTWKIKMYVFSLAASKYRL